MTQEKVAFIDRASEMRQIEGLIADWGVRHVLCIHGEGGIGKTRLLQEVRERWRRETARLVVTEVLTFDDRTLRIPENLRERLAGMLGKENFEPYRRRLMDYQKMMMKADLSMERLEQESQEVVKAFHDCLCKALRERRGVILLDTTDVLEVGVGAWDYIASGLALQPCNVVFLIAGRNAQTLYEQLRPCLEDKVHLLSLLPLSEESSIEYLKARQDQLHCAIDPEIARKVIFLADGRPILIDLAVDWLSHQLPLPWLEKESLEDIKRLSSEDIEKRRKEFEYNLVRRVLELRTNTDRLLLALTHVYPVNAALAAELLQLDECEAATLLEDVQSYISVKRLPNGEITLHDKVRELLEAVEAEVDPEGQRKRSDNQRAASYFEKMVHTLKQERQALEEQAGRGAEAQEEFEAAIKRADVERRYWEAAGQWLHNELRASPDRGIRIFADVFDEATNLYRVDVRESFVKQVDLVAKQLQELTPAQRYEWEIRRAKYLLDRGKYQEGKDLLLKMLGYAGLEPAQQVDMHIQLGNLVIRLGDFRVGQGYFETAVKLSRENNLERELMLALNALGWSHRLMGRFEQAINCYKEALELSVRLRSRKQEGWLLNNLAFASARLGRHKAALNLCDQAMAVWREVGYERGLGAVHEVYGEVYVLSERFDDALKHYRAALDIFEPSNDTEWLSRVYAGCGLAYRLAGDLENAERFLRKALDIGLAKDEATILHRLGHVYLARDRVDEAEQYFLKSYERCKDIADADLELNNLSDLANIALRKGQYERLGEFAAAFEAYQRYWPDVGFRRAEGTLLKTLGDLALCTHPDVLEPAWQYYEKAFPLLAEYGELRPYNVRDQLMHLNNLLRDRQVPAKTVKELGERLWALWQKGLDRDYPDVLRFFLRWREGEYYVG